MRNSKSTRVGGMGLAARNGVENALKLTKPLRRSANEFARIAIENSYRLAKTLDIVLVVVVLLHIAHTGLIVDRDRQIRAIARI